MIACQDEPISDPYAAFLDAEKYGDLGWKINFSPEL